MRSLLLFALLAGPVTLSQAACRDQYDTCKSTFDRSVQQIGAGSAPDTLCNVGNTYIACLEHLTELSICKMDNTMINTLNTDRRKTEELLNQNATGCLLCTQEVDTCKSTFLNSKSQAGNDITAICKDAQTMVLCLRRVDVRPECASEKSRIEEQRRKAEQKLTDGGCDVGKTCIQNVDQCNKQEEAANQAAQTHAQQCTVSNGIFNCLSGQLTVCTGEYLKDVKNALAFVKAAATDRNCTITADASGATGQHSSSSVTSLLVPLLLAVAAALK